MIIRWLRSISILFILLLCTGASTFPVFAQNNSATEVEVYLDFRHRGIINSVVISYYKDDQFYLPVSELFSLFQIDHTVNGLIIDGRFGLEQTPYSINFQQDRLRVGNQTLQLEADDYLVKELDSYLRADIFYQAFELDFRIDFNNLSLNLVTDKELPVVEEAIRKQRRRVADSNRLQRANYELRFDRERPFIDGGFVDYNLSANLNNTAQVYNFNTNLGLQVYGGDLQGNIFGSYSENFTNFATNNLRWRYMFRDQTWLTKLTIGQATTDGFTRNAYTGIRLSNEPIEPRRLFDEFVVDGETIPESEVELYLNNSLIDYQQSDELGNYRFLTPISYGSSQLDLRIYGPTGQIIERSTRIQIPFTFQPKGVFNYTLNAGRLDNPIFGETTQNLTAQGSGSYGVTDWLTAKVGAEYYEGLSDGMPSLTSSLSSRIMTNYILTLETASDAYYRGIFNVIYPNSASFNIDYTDFISGSNIYNPANEDKRIVASAFYPFTILGLPFNLRATTFSRIRASTNSTSFKVDANSRIGKLNLRVGYSDRYTGQINLLDPTNSAYFESSATYNISRNRNIPPYIRGVFLRAQMRYQPSFEQIESAEFLISRNVFDQGRFQLSYGRNFVSKFNSLRFSLVVNFDKFRTSSTYSNIRNSGNFSQNIRGSIGYDTNYNNLLLTSRDQVGRAATAIKLYVDNNGDGKLDDSDSIIEENAVRLQSSGASSIIKDGVIYHTQMQPYYYYNMEINKSAIKNPMLVPEFEKFGLISDPNRFKKVEIPFYMSGVLEGVVERQQSNNTRSGIGGLKVLLTQTNGDFSKELRTFSDGSFYDYELPPGEYELRVAPSQLEILNSRSIPEEIEFEVEALPEGDFVEGISFLLVPTGMTDEDLQQIAEAAEATPETESDTSQIVDLTEDITLPDTSAADIGQEEGIAEAVTDTLSNEEQNTQADQQAEDQNETQQGDADQDGADNGLPAVIPPSVLPITGIEGLTDLGTDSTVTDSLPETVVEKPIAEATNEPEQVPDSTTIEVADTTDVISDSTAALADGDIVSETEEPVDSLGVDTDTAIEDEIIPPVITGPELAEGDSLQTSEADSAIAEVTDVSADSAIAETAEEEEEEIADAQVEAPQDSISAGPEVPITETVPPVTVGPEIAESDSVETAVTDSSITNITNVTEDSTAIALADEDVQEETEDPEQPEDSLGVDTDKGIEGVITPPVIAGPELADGDSLQDTEVDSVIADLQQEEELPADSADQDQNISGDEEIAIPPTTALPETNPVLTAQNMDEGIPNAFSSDNEIESLIPGACIYGIQFASYSRESQADNLSRRLEEEHLTFTVFNTPYNLYALREIQYQSLARVSSATKELNTSSNFDAAVISQCYADLDLNPETPGYYIQLEEFATEENAQQRIRELKSTYDITASVMPRNGSGVRVGIGPMRSERQAVQRFRELRDDLAEFDNANIRRYVPPVKVVDLSFEFLLLLNEFNTEEEALAYGRKIEDNHSVKTKVLQDENKEKYTVTTELMNNWSRINNLKSEISGSGLAKEPVILMVEIRN